MVRGAWRVGVSVFIVLLFQVMVRLFGDIADCKRAAPARFHTINYEKNIAGNVRRCFATYGRSVSSDRIIRTTVVCNRTVSITVTFRTCTVLYSLLFPVMIRIRGAEIPFGGFCCTWQDRCFAAIPN